MKPVDPSHLSELEHAFELGSASELYPRVLMVRFSGRHTGMDDTRFMEAHIGLGVSLFVPDAVVLDLGGLELAHGEALHGVIRPVEPNLEEGFPLYVVASRENRTALLVAFPDKAVVVSVDEALDRIARQGPWAMR